MSWRTGSTLFIEIFPLVQANMPEQEDRIDFLADLLKVFIRNDMETDEVEDVHPDIRAAMRQIEAEAAEPERFDDDDQDDLILDLATHLGASKHMTYIKSVIAIFESIASFLQDNGLTVRPIFEAGQPMSPTFRLMRSDLTSEGSELIRRALARWMNGISDGKWPATDTSVLAQTLSKIRAPRNKSE